MKKTHNFSLCVNTWLAGCSVSSSWQYFSVVPSTSSPGFYNSFFFSLSHSSHKLYLRTHVVHKNTHVQLLTNTVEDAQALPGERLPVGRRRDRWRFHPAAGGQPETRHYLVCVLLFFFFVRNKSNWWENHEWFKSAAKSGKIQPLHQPITDRAASSSFMQQQKKSAKICINDIPVFSSFCLGSSPLARFSEDTIFVCLFAWMRVGPQYLSSCLDGVWECECAAPCRPRPRRPTNHVEQKKKAKKSSPRLKIRVNLKFSANYVSFEVPYECVTVFFLSRRGRQLIEKSEIC